MLNLTLDQLDQSVNKFFDKYFSERCECLRTHLSVSPTQSIDGFQYDLTTLVAKDLKLKEKILIGITHWYFPVEIRFLFHLWLSENWGAEAQEIRDLLLTSKSTALGYLIIQEDFNESDFFGNILSKTKKDLLLRFNFKRLSNKRVKKYTGYCRGYRESGLWTPHQPEKALRKRLLTLDEIEERERIQQQKFDYLLNKISELIE